MTIPDDDPPLLMHSVFVKHVPLYPFAAPQGSFGNFTTLKTLSCFSALKNIFFSVDKNFLF